MVNEAAWLSLKRELDGAGATLVAVSKTKPAADIMALYNLGQRDFGENYVQELIDKKTTLPDDIRWHFIGHLQSNKVRQVAPFVHLIHAVDSLKLLTEINKQGETNDRVIDVLLQMYIGAEATKYGLTETELVDLLHLNQAQLEKMRHVRVCGLMGMATHTDDARAVTTEFNRCYALFNDLRQSFFRGQPHFSVCSLGMSADFRLAILAGSNMVRIGSLLFGPR